MNPVNFPFTKADLASHVLRMCPLTWQDQFNLHEKGMMDMCSLLMSLRAIEQVCTQEKSSAQSGKKASNRGKKGKGNLVLMLLSESPRKLTPKSIATSAKSMGAHILRTIQETAVSMRKTEWRKAISALTRKAERNPILQSNLLCS
jgi:hypothetical protein